MKKITLIIVTVCSLLLLTGCATLGMTEIQEFFGIKSWNIFDKVEAVDDNIKTGISDAGAKIEETAEIVVDKVDEVVDEVIDDTIDVVQEVSAWFEVQEEKIENTVETVVDETTEVVETTVNNVENAVSDVLNSITTGPTNPVIVVPAKSNSDSSTNETESTAAQTETAPAEPEKKSATQQVAESVVSDTTVDAGSNAVLIIILIAVGLIGIAIAYYCISIKKKSY